jgi:hypothetical protein
VVERRTHNPEVVGSTPTFRNQILAGLMVRQRSPKPLIAVRFRSGMPNVSRKSAPTLRSEDLITNLRVSYIDVYSN